MSESPTVITGTVRDLAGHPVAGARISFVEGPVPLADIAALTAEDGTFSLTAPVAGIYRIACHADGFRSQSSTITVGTGTHITLNFTMR
jgi:Carboxypeptidase regulatory-like domain